MLRQFLTKTRINLQSYQILRRMSDDTPARRAESLLKQELDLPGAHLDEIEEILIDGALKPLEFYPNLGIKRDPKGKPIVGHNVVVIQPWASYSNFGELTDPDLQLDECVSLANTIDNWNVIGKKLIYSHHLNRKQIFGLKAFDELKELIYSHSGVSAVFFGVELLSGIQFSTLEHELQLAVYDRFTVVMNIFRQHAKTREAKIQLALAELPYIKSHLREIHLSSENSSSASSLKTLVGGAGERSYHLRLGVLKSREKRLRHHLNQIKKQRDVNKKLRRNSDVPLVSIVGYTNCGKTSLIKYLTEDKRLVPMDQLFATLDVSVHVGCLPSSKTVFYQDTVGFLSRIPKLLMDAFSVTLSDVQESDLIIHLLDVTHPDHRLQHETVVKALDALKISKELIQSKLTVGNKLDLLLGQPLAGTLPGCDLHVSTTNNINLQELVEAIDKRLMNNLKHQVYIIKVENGGQKYSWLRKNATVLECMPDEMDGSYLVCRVVMSPTASGRWHKFYGRGDILLEDVYTPVKGNE